jgi:LysM repeat protein
MTIITRALLALALCLFGMAAHAETHTAIRGDSVERVAKATGTTPAQIINANKRKIKAPLYWMYIGETYNVPLPPPQADARVNVTETLATAPKVVAAEKGKATLAEAIAIVQKDIADSAKRPVTVQESSATKALPPIPTKPAKKRRIIRTQVVVQTTSLETTPDLDRPCTNCTLETFLVKSDLPTDVASQLSDKVVHDEYEHISVVAGEEFALMQFEDNALWQSVTAKWRDKREVRAREYTVRAHGLVYSFVYHAEGGNWSVRPATPDIDTILPIKRELEHIVGREHDVTPLAILIWKAKYQGGIPPPTTDRERSAYAEVSGFINRFLLQGAVPDNNSNLLASTTLK